MNHHPHGMGSLLRLLIFVIVAAGAPIMVGVPMHWFSS